MRVAVQEAVAVGAVDVEAEQDLAPARALFVAVAEDLREAAAVDELGDDHALAAEVAHHLRHVDERVAAVLAGERAVVGRLELVVELLGDALTQLVGDLLGVEARRDPAEQLQHHADVLEVGADDVLDAGVLDLDGDRAAVVQLRLVDLADRGCGYRLLVELGERVLEGLAEVVLDDLLHVFEGDARGHRLQLGELGLELLAVGLGDRADVDHAERLADLHGRALHRPEHGDDAVRRLEVLAADGLVLLLGRADDVRRRRPRRARGRTRREPSEPRHPPDARLVHPLVVSHGPQASKASTVIDGPLIAALGDNSPLISRGIANVRNETVAFRNNAIPWEQSTNAFASSASSCRRRWPRRPARSSRSSSCASRAATHSLRARPAGRAPLGDHRQDRR